MKVFDRSIAISSALNEAAELVQQAYELAEVRDTDRFTQRIATARRELDKMAILERNWRRAITS